MSETYNPHLFYYTASVSFGYRKAITSLTVESTKTEENVEDRDIGTRVTYPTRYRDTCLKSVLIKQNLSRAPK